MVLDSLSKKQYLSSYDNKFRHINSQKLENCNSKENIVLWGADNKNADESNWFKNWLNDKDKICTDGKDDGRIGFEEIFEHFGKGVLSFTKGVINHPFISLGALAGGTLLTMASGGALLPVMVAAGAALGTVQIGSGVYKAITADTDAEAKMAWENIGTGTFALTTSTLGARSALKFAGKAGVDSALGGQNLSKFKALGQCFKSIPESLKVSGKNIYYNTRSFCGIPKPQISAQEIFRRDKLEIENTLRIRLEDVTKNGKDSSLARYNPKAIQEKILNSINEDNIEFAKMLMKNEHYGKNSLYLVEKERYCDYYAETMYKLLNAKPETQQLALEVLDKKFASSHRILGVLNDNNHEKFKQSFFVERIKKYVTQEGVIIDDANVPTSDLAKHYYLKKNNLREITVVLDEKTGKYVDYNELTELNKFLNFKSVNIRPFELYRDDSIQKWINTFYDKASINGAQREAVVLYSDGSLDPDFFGELLWGENCIKKTPENLALLQTIIDKYQTSMRYNTLREEIISTFYGK